MEKTLLQPSTHTDIQSPKVSSNEGNESLEALTEEMKPVLETAAKQLLQPDNATLEKLFKQLSS